MLIVSAKDREARLEKKSSAPQEDILAQYIKDEKPGEGAPKHSASDMETLTMRVSQLEALIMDLAKRLDRLETAPNGWHSGWPSWGS